MIGLLNEFRKLKISEKQPTVLARKNVLTEEYSQQAERVGLLCTRELEIATERCRKKVKTIAKQCHAHNRRFRDLEFDLGEDRERCLHGLTTPVNNRYTPADVMRISQLFNNPKFFIDGTKYSDIQQGRIDDCWLLSALATVSTMEGMLDKICVARDEEVGVYGFIFYRDAGWIDVVIDDLLFTSIPKYEQLSQLEQSLYHNSKEKFKRLARKGGRGLYFAKGSTENETWVPLLEKAYAKLHGDYAAIAGGLGAEAVEDLTGGVSTMFYVHDILSPDRFWKEELCKANQDRLFGCYINNLTGESDDIIVNGLFANHAYSIVSAKELNGKRFVRIRNPWGRSEWTGAWSDGSKEWTPEWLALLPKLEYNFGDDGEFLMEYSDFLDSWALIERTKLFDGGWKMSSLWLNVTARSSPCVWDYGDVSFTFVVTENVPAVVVLSQLNERHFSEISGCCQWSLDFVIYRKGADFSDPYASPTHTILWGRSVSIELENLEAGEYVVHVRLDRREIRKPTYIEDTSSEWDRRKYGKVWSGACVSMSIAANFDPTMFGNLLPADPRSFGGKDLTTTEIALHEKLEQISKTSMNTSRLPSETPAQTENDVGSGLGTIANSERLSSILHPAPSPFFTLGIYATDSESTYEDDQVDKSKMSDGATSEGAESNGAKNGDTSPYLGSVRPNEIGGDVSVASHLQGPTVIVHEDWWCRACKVDPIIGPRYLCLDVQCRDYNLCEACVVKDVHDKSHRMLRIEDSSEARKLQDNSASDHNNVLTLGLRVYTKSRSGATISGQLRHGKLIGWEKTSV